MVNVTSVALSGFSANSERIAVASDNIANLNTKDFEAKEQQLSSVTPAGVSSRVVSKDPGTVPVPNSEGGIDQMPNVSLEEELVGVNMATYGAKANLKVLQAQDKMNKYLLDIQA